MRILIVSDAWHPQVNGVVRTYECVVRELEKRGHKVCVIGPADFNFTLPLPGYPEIRLAPRPYRALEKMITDFAPDTIHIATEGPLGWAARAWCRRHNNPFSTSYHTHFPDYLAQRISRFCPVLYKPVQAFGKFYIRAFHKPSDLILVATPGLVETLRSWGFKNSMHLFSRGVDSALFHPGPQTLFKTLKRPVALYVGRVAIEKNLPEFLDMPWNGSKVVVGEGPLLAQFRRTYPYIVFTSKKTGEELADHYRSADVFVFPSRTDTFGIVIVEALACGLPVAAYDVTGPRDIITDPAFGALDKQDLGAAAKRALAAAASSGERAARSCAYYSWAQAAVQFEDALRQVALQGADTPLRLAS